jgi:ribosomal protein RSM22 (predicted rRNA methylase)
MVTGYPQWFEEWWVRYVCEQFSCNSISDKEAQVVKAAQTLSDLFTTQRAELGAKYASDPKLLAAYGLYFFPENFIRGQFVITEMLQRGWRPPRNPSVLDLGSGTGAAAFSICHAFQGSIESMKVLAVDQSKAALQLSERLAEGLHGEWRNLDWQTLKTDFGLRFPEGADKYDLIVAAFALNENDSDILQFVQKCAKAMSENGLLLIIEPASQQISEGVEQLRDSIARQQSLRIWGPCLHELRCPMLEASKFWCHEVRRWNPPQSLLFLNRKLQRQLDVLKFSFLALGKQPPAPLTSNAYRIVSPITRVKGKWIWEGCATDGNIHEYQLLKRNADARALEIIKTLERGDVVGGGTKCPFP